MCKVCSGNFLTISSDYEKLCNQAKEIKLKWLRKNPNLKPEEFGRDIMVIDNLRWTESGEWGEPITAPYTYKNIFNNKDPKQGLDLFVICCWLDLQQDYRIIWSKLLEQAHSWILNVYEESRVPRGTYPATYPTLIKTSETLKSQCSFANWFTITVIQIANENGKAKGNLYRFFGLLIEDFLEVSSYLHSQVNWLKMGNLDFLGQWKRAWMFLMFVRRDRNIISCLLKRALNTIESGQKAFDLWYDDDYFSNFESELPVDKRVLDIWKQLWGVPDFNQKDVALNAHGKAVELNMPPSAFDALFFSKPHKSCS